MRKLFWWILVVALVCFGCAGRRKARAATAAAGGWSERGVASWYGHPYHGRRAASGEIYDMDQMTAAHRKLPLGTKVMVENLETGEKVEVKITDRGPYADKRRRIIDLSKAAADSIGIVEQGVAPVRVTITERPPEAQKAHEDEATFFEVQVGAFEAGEQADAVLEQVKAWFPEAYIAPRDGPAGEYYRVRVGPFQSKQEAQRIANALKRGGHRVFLDEVPESALPEEAAQQASDSDHERTSPKR